MDNQLNKIIENNNLLKEEANEIFLNSEKQIEINKFKNVQLNYLKTALKQNQITKEQFDEYKNSLDCKVKEYIKKLNDDLDLDYSVAIWAYENDVNLKRNLNYKEINKQHKKELENIQENNKEEIKAINYKYKLFNKSLSIKTIIALMLFSVLTVLIVGLVINYTYFFEIANNGKKFNFKNENHVVGFVFAMIASILAIATLFFLTFKTTKRIFLDKEQSFEKTFTIGTIGSFTDTIGVGSFAITNAMLISTNSVPNLKKMPGTMNVGLAIPNLAAGALFASAITVDLTTLITLVISAMIGAFVASFIVSYVNKKYIALFAGIVLFIAGIASFVIVILKVLDKLDVGTNGLEGWKLAIGIIALFIIGGMQTFGIGVYAPAMAVVLILGMKMDVAFPIMTCAAGFGLPTTVFAFHKDNNYSPKVAIGLTIGGVVGTIIAFLSVFVFIQGGLGVKPDKFTKYLGFLGVAVMFYASTMLILKYISYSKEDKTIVKVQYKNYIKENSSNYLSEIEHKISEIASISSEKNNKLNMLIQQNNITKLQWK